jgi:hypothetical protein
MLDQDRLRLGILDTQISRPVAALLASVFVALIAAVPAAQALLEHLAEEDSSLAALFEHAPTQEHLRQLEQDIEQASYPKDFVQPRLQLLLSQFGRVGNKRALIGHDGYLFYTPGLTHIAGPSFLDPSALAERALQDAALQPDPRPAIHELAAFLAARGIALVLFPVPDKTALQPRELHGRDVLTATHNLGWAELTRDLEQHGIRLFDPTPLQLSAAEPPRFLEQDTHWTPTWMQQVAAQLAGDLRALLPSTTSAHAYHSVSQRAERVGDLVDMLKLPESQSLFPTRGVQLDQVQDERGALWAPDPEADVLLLGDSFTNVFTEGFMGWGEAAGFGPQLSLALGRPIDVIAQNDSGAFATRKLLEQALARGEDRLRGKRVVIWELAARELSVGDWKHVDWRAAAPEAR